MSASRFLSAVVVFLLSLCLNAGPGLSAAERQTDNAILFGWDGAQRNHVREAMSREELPTLATIASEGAIVEIDILRATDTKAGWSQILTGYNPEVSGVYSNGRYEPIPEGLTIFERLETFFGEAGIATAAVIGKKGHVDNDAPARLRESGWRSRRLREMSRKQRREGQVAVINGVRYRMIPGKPYYNASKNMDVFINGLVENEKVATKAIKLLETYKDNRFFFFVHFAEVDAKGHKFGENSDQYNDALISDDYWTGKIIEKLRDLGLYDKTAVYITADHGFDEDRKTHADAPYVFLATNDAAVTRSGERADVAPTILERLGIVAETLTPPLDGRTLTKPLEQPKW